MPTERDYYDLLGIPRNAPDEEVKRAYRRLAIELHPDRNPGDPNAEERFKRASQAYSVLSSPEKRRRYDRMGHSAFASAGGSQQGSGDQGDFEAFGEALGTLFGDLLRTNKKGRRPRDLKLDLTIRFEEAALGCEKTVEITRNEPCDACAGSGAAPGHSPTTCPACRGRGEVRYQRGLFPASRPCQTCGGTGKEITHACARCTGSGVVPKQVSFQVTIPSGAENGSVRSVRGAGEYTPAGRADLHITLRVEPHALFTRSGADLLCTVPITYPQAVLGDLLEVPTLSGLVRMKLPPGTESGRVFRLRGKGLPVFGGVGKGDQLVTVVIEVPQEVSSHQKHLLEQLAVDMGDAGLPARRSFRDKLRFLFG